MGLDHLVGGGEAVLLALEVLVEGAAGDLRRGGDRGDRGRVVAVLGDGLDDAVEQPFALVLGDEDARESCVCEALGAGDPGRLWDALPELMHFAAGSYFGNAEAEGAFERASIYLERRLIGAALALVATRGATGDPQRLRELEPELTDLLLASL